LVKRAVVKAFLARAKGLLTIGTQNAAFYRSYGAPDEPMFLTPYAVDNSFFMDCALQYAGQKSSLRQSLGLPVDKPIILFSGKFQAKKRPLDLLHTFKIVREQAPAALVFVGDGALRAEMERLIAEIPLEDVYLMGFRNQTEITQFYALSDILVLPSDYEPWGLVVNEAMCFGLPVVASDQVGAAADLVREGVNGCLFPVGDITTLAQRLLTLVQDAALRTKMGEASRRIICEWGLEQDVEGILQALRSIIGSRRAQVQEVTTPASHDKR
jgi:glycosyltransferase involved in cell wall biosynthesis